MKKYVIPILCVIVSLSFIFSIYAFTHYRTHDYYYDSQRNFVNYGKTEEGTDIDESEWFIVTYRYNVTDSGGKEHSLIIGRQIYARVNGKWKWQTGWWLPYEDIKKFFDKHCSN